MPIKSRRWNDPAEANDGFRLLICRYRPRGVRKEDETWDAWCKDLGPSKELHADYYGKNGDPIDWETYRRRYLEEMKTITLLCSSACVDAAHCHRTLLRGLIEERVAARKR